MYSSIVVVLRAPHTFSPLEWKQGLQVGKHYAGTSIAECVLRNIVGILARVVVVVVAERAIFPGISHSEALSSLNFFLNHV